MRYSVLIVLLLLWATPVAAQTPTPPYVVVITPTAPDMSAWYAAMWSLVLQCREVLLFLAGGMIALTVADIVLALLRWLWTR